MKKKKRRGPRMTYNAARFAGDDKLSTALRESRVRVDLAQRARRACYQEAALFLEALTRSGVVKYEVYKMPNVDEMARAAGVFHSSHFDGRQPDATAIRDAARHVAGELWRRVKGRGPYDRKTTVVVGKVHRKRRRKR